MKGLIDKVLLELVGLPHVLDLAVQQVGGGGPCNFSVSPSPLGLDFGTSDSGLTIIVISLNPVQV